MRLSILTYPSCLFALLFSTAVLAQERGEGAPVVEFFEKVCLTDFGGVESIKRDVAQQPGWVSVDFPTDYKQQDSTTNLAWSGEIQGRAFTLLLAHTPKWKSQGTQCMLRTQGKEPNFFPYLDKFKQVLGERGIKGKEIDIPHYFRASGKLSNGRSAQAELMTRSWAGAVPNYTILRIQY